MRIVVVIGQLGTGGAEKQALLLHQGLVHRGHTSTLVVLDRGTPPAVAPPPGVVFLERGRTGDVVRLAQLVSVLRRVRPDVLHGFDYSGSIYGRLAAVIAGVRVRLSGVRCDWAPPARVLRAERLLRPVTRAVISNSYSARTSWSAMTGWPLERIVVVPNGHVSPPIRERGPAPGAEPLIVSVGSMTERKNPALFLEVARRWAGPGRFVWFGDGPLRPPLLAAIASSDLCDRVSLPGATTDVAGVLAGCHVGVMTSDAEGLPNAVLDYMSAGLPTVATDVGDTARLLENGQHGLVVPPRDPAAMVDALRSVLESPDRAAAMGASAQRAAARFTVDAMVDQTLDVYRRAIQERW